MNDIYIIGGGASLRDFDFKKLKNKDCIAINYSIVNVPTSKYFITMDYTFIDYIEQKTKKQLTKKKFKALPCEKYFVVATNNKYIQKQKDTYIDTRSNYKYDLTGIDRVIPSNIEYGIGHDYEHFVHGCNSGFCALQLALLLGYKNIHLLGFDLTSTYDTHYHMAYMQSKGKFIKRLEVYKKHFYVAIRWIEKNYSEIKISNYAKDGYLANYLDTKSLDTI